MSQSLISLLVANPDAGVIGRIAAETGASEEKLENCFRAVVAAILGGIVRKTDEPDGMRQVFSLVTGRPSVYPNSPREQGQRLLSTIFGSNQSSVVEEISHKAELPSGVVDQTLSIASPMVVSALASRVQDQGVSLSGFPNLLFREVGDVSSYLPASVQKLLRTATPVSAGSTDGLAPDRKASSVSRGRILAICLVAVLLFGMFSLIRRSQADVATIERAEDMNRSRERFSGLGRFKERDLPGGVRLDIPENGMESKLISYLQDRSKSGGKDQWFDFDRVTFHANSAIPEAESEEQLTNLASILKAYPKVRLKVGGYTDTSGSRRANQRLSENRAESVRRELVGLGIDSGRVEVEGYGDQHPIADNATEQGRTTNRRISLKVLQK